MALTFASFIASTAGKLVVIPGYKSGECVAPFWLFNSQHHNEHYSADGAANLWTTANGYPYTWDSYSRVTSGYKYGDWLIWAGNRGAYPNAGSGHVAMFLRYDSAGRPVCMSENPGPFREQTLNPDGIMGALRATGVPAGTAPAPAKPAGPALVNRTVTNPVAWVRTAPKSGAPLAADFPRGIAKGPKGVIAVKGYVVGEDPYGTGDNAWYVTVNNRYVWANAAGNSLAGLRRL